jgi:hypothetical protein
MPRLGKEEVPALKLDGYAETLEDAMPYRLRRELFEHPGRTVLAVVELHSVTYTGHAAGEGKDPHVKVRLGLVEVARDEHQTKLLAEVQRAMFRRREMAGSLDELGLGAHALETAAAEFGAAHPTEDEYRQSQRDKRDAEQGSFVR